ncbi:MAG: family 20 glycosylhydrolase [Flavobacteriaceae bacterium]|nr:family 20 glycosylhydrolase [Flavobacteriaceae bacterium]
MKKIILIVIGLVSFSCFSQSNNLNLMPWPQEIVFGNSNYTIEPNFTIAVNQETNKRIDNATTKFLKRLSGRTGVFIEQGFAYKNSEIENPSLEINFKRIGKLKLNEDESYQLKVSKDKISINASTDIGVIYALETLLQLVTNNESAYFFPEIIINDAPRFPWRGLMMDVARHYQPLDVIKRNLDAMASVKLNVFHWHLTDDQGFRVEINSRPKLHQLGSDGQYYTHDQIKEVVQYASDLGIRVVPEFDIPGHATSWLVAYPEIASKDTIYEIERYSGIFNPTLDPTNDETYEILNDVITEISPLFPDNYFHIGGDENEGKHWDENKKIQAFKIQHGIKNNHELQAYFNIRVQKILEDNGKTMMGWDEIFQPGLPKDVVIHSWRGTEAMLKAAKLGYKTVLSKGYYIDLLESVRLHYTNEPFTDNHGLTDEELKNILGGEATMWSELVTPITIDSRIWPRTAAIAERLWSNKAINDVDNMFKRLEVISSRLEELGITHIRNRDVILRNISNHQNIEALIKLTKVYEPLKIYTRNKGGKKYKTYSPFTLFADACTADASDAIIFNNLTKKYLSGKDANSKKELISILNKWVENDVLFTQLKINPILKNIAPLSKNLAEISQSLISILISEKIKTSQYKILKNQYLEIKKPLADVEFASLNSFKLIIEYYSQKNNLQIDLNNSSIQQ